MNSGYGAFGLAEAVVLVTGAASGIGRATALEFSRTGARVAAADVDETGGRSLVYQIKEEGGEARFLTADVADAGDCSRAVQETISTFGRLDALVNAAGVIQRSDVLGTTEEQWDRIMDVNLKSVFLLSRYSLPHMLDRGGSIVNVSSGWGLRGGPKAVAYCASKGGVVLLTKAMAWDHAAEGVRVNCVCPGDVDTPMLRGEADELGVSLEAFMRDSADRPMGRVGQPEEVAAAILFLASGLATYITGAALIVDGGGLA
jgi:NAD(P)-dependent dehydrogenase (short-subunit alcohol dehydrogenase family)